MDVGKVVTVPPPASVHIIVLTPPRSLKITEGVRDTTEDLLLLIEAEEEEGGEELFLWFSWSW